MLRYGFSVLSSAGRDPTRVVEVRAGLDLLEGFASGDREALTTREFGPVVGCY